MRFQVNRRSSATKVQWSPGRTRRIFSCYADEVMFMPPDALALYAAVILLLPMACFFLSTPTFLLVGLEVPEVTQLLRGLFNGYFLVMSIAGTVAAVGFAVAGRPVFAVGPVAVAGFAI